MLLELNVRDIALIRQACVEFREGLNIMTGETGAGKSVIIGSCMLALGEKARPDLIREGAADAYAELVFSVTEEQKKIFSEMGFDLSEGTLVLSRKISPARSISRINGENVSLKTLREAASHLIDLYGQNEYHTLMDPENHLKILDTFLSSAVTEEKKAVSDAYRLCRQKTEALSAFQMDEAERIREEERAEYEITEIDEAALSEGEEEELSAEYRKLNHARNIVEYLGQAHEALRADSAGEALSLTEAAMKYDPELSGIRQELSDAADILYDAMREISSYLDNCDLSEARMAEVEKRLDLIRALENKYGRTVTDVLSWREKQAQRLAMLNSYEEEREKAQKEKEAAEKVLRRACAVLTEKRRQGAAVLCEKIRQELPELGFGAASVELRFEEKEPAENGADRVCFYAALNPGERLKPLAETASGGELSRVMLSIKTVLAGSDGVSTLIFDEIDAGISGRTAQKVAEKLSVISAEHQVICITHLPQIAAMADAHFVITKNESEGRNVTAIRELTGEEPVQELARLLSGAELTGSVLENAREMKMLADEKKDRKRRGIAG